MTISIRIICMDYYMATPGAFDRSFSPFSKKELSKVPVVRVFGSTLAGQKVCLHVHQVYPYFFIPYTPPEELKTEQEIQKDIFQFGTTLNEAMNIARPNAEKDEHIVAIVLTRGVPFYGYHVGYEYYLKIYLANPYEKQQMLDLLQSEAILGTRFQPFEAHLNFELQFLMDYNLYGMDWIHIDEEQPLYSPSFRLPLLEDPKSSFAKQTSSTTMSSDHILGLLGSNSPFNVNSVYTSKTVPEKFQTDSTPRDSYCELELDITGMSIINRLDLEERDIHVDLDSEKSIQRNAVLNPDKKMVKSLESIWKDEASRRRSRGITDSIPSVSQTGDRDPHIPWIAETSLRQLMKKMMSESDKSSPLNNAKDRSRLLSGVLTIFEANEALYPEEYQIWKEQYLHRDMVTTSDSYKQSNISTSPLSESKLPTISNTSPYRSITPPRTTQKPNSQFNITATPSRYSVWDISTQLDKSIINSLVKESSFLGDCESNDEDEEIHDKAKAKSEEDYYFSQAEDISDSGLNNWIENVDKLVSNHPTTAIEYAEQEIEPYSPRKIDFMSEAERIDNILQQKQVIKAKRDMLSDMIESDEENSEIESEFTTDAKACEVDDVDVAAIDISDIPPNHSPWLQQQKRKKRRIPQEDGSKDFESGDDKKVKKSNLAAVKWEKELKTLKRMRKPVFAGSRTDSDNIQRKTVTMVAEAKSSESESFLKNSVQSQSVQKATVHTTTTSSSLPLDGSVNFNTKKSSPFLKTISTTENQTFVKGNPADLTVFQNDQGDEDEISNKDSLGDMEALVLSHKNNNPLNVSENSKQMIAITNEASSKGVSSSFFYKSPSLNNFVDTTLPSQIHGHSQSNIAYKKFNHNSPTSLAGPTQMAEMIYKNRPPKLSDITFPERGILYKEPYYSKPSDLPRYPTVFAGKEFKLPTSGISSWKEFVSFIGNKTVNSELLPKVTKIRVWSPIIEPPTTDTVKEWIRVQDVKKKVLKNSPTQLDKPSADNTYGFKISASKPQAKVRRVRDYIDYFSLEIHVNTREKLRPDPQHDAVQLIFWCLQTEDQHILSNGYQEDYLVGVIALREFDIHRVGISDNRAVVDYADSEEQMFMKLIEKIRFYDPDMLTGYEVQSASWGYLVERGVELGIHLLDELSRVMATSATVKKDQWGSQNTSSYKVCGRHMLNIWRLMKGEIALTSYTFENIAYHLLRDRMPHFSYKTLTTWYLKGSPVLKYRLIKYYLKRVQMNLDILDASQVVTRACESARVYGIDFYSVLSRGSQYKVESIMFRIAKPENFVLLTPNRKQVASQRSLECLPLIMEPITQFYSSPMVVLDFQSLYPSIMIAYNYCYSTCLGRVRSSEESSRFGVQAEFSLPDGLLSSLKDHINISPNGVMFVKPEIRKSLLAKMLTELLDTRVMIKRAMKDYKDDSGLLRMLDAKQLTLKLLANVTYGYTSASFSGRMPSVEIADSIVSTGRETLERTIKLINNTKEWGAHVVYGDTDSVFVYFPGKTKEEAFTLGNEIADTVTKQNPLPIKLKFEKVYHPAVLLAKKRYVGFKYENRNDVEPSFEAKGIETVRRDGTAATQNILESCLKILFRSQDMSELKDFLYEQWTKILSNRVNLQDFIISKEVKMGSYAGQGPNGAQIAQAQMNEDVRAEPQYGERVPYVVVYRGPKAKLKDKVVRPEDFLADDTLRLDAEYYIRKQIIPPLSRVFNLMGVDVESWYDSMPRAQKADALALAQVNQLQNQRVTRIDQYYASSYCVVCCKVTDQNICEQCRKVPSKTIFTLLTRQQLAQVKFRKVLQTCQNCSKISPLNAMTVSSEEIEQFADVPCNSLDCPTFYQRYKAKKDVRATQAYGAILDSLSF